MRENSIKKMMLTALSALFVVSATMGVATLTNAQAESSDPSIMAAGASVRVKYDENNAAEAQNKNGIRFASYLKNVAVGDIAESYALIIPTDLISGELTPETEGVKKEDLSGKWHTYNDEDEGEVLRSMVVIYDVAKASYSRNVTVETYVRLTDGTVLETNYQDENYKGTRSLDSVAEMVKADTEEYNKLVAATPQAAGILDTYDVNITAGTFVDFAEVELSAGAAESAAITATPAFWKNYYKNYNTFSVSVKIDGTVSDVTKLEYVAADETTKIDLPLYGFVAGVAKQVPVDFNFVNNYDVLTGGKFVATIAADSTATITVAPMKASAVETKTIEEKYYYSREDKDLRLNFIDGIETADKVLSVKYEGEDVAFTLNTEKNRIVFAKDVLSKVEINSSNTIEIQTATTKYRMTKVTPFNKAFYEADDLFVTDDDGNTYSYFDLTSISNRWPTETVTNQSTSKNVTVTKISGYYVLANDINLSGDLRVIRHKKTSRPANAETSVNSKTLRQHGFRGTFDGNGHTITGMTVGAGGLFCYVSHLATIKNVAFKDVNFKDDTDNNTFLLGYNLCGSSATEAVTLENIYVSVKTMHTAYMESPPTSGDIALCSVLCNAITKFAFIKNIIVDMSALGEVNVVGRGMFGSNIAVDEMSNVDNFYVVGQAPICFTHKNISGTYYALVVDAGNRTDVVWVGNKFVYIKDTKMLDCIGDYVTYSTNAEVYRFVKADDLGTHFATNDAILEEFDNGYWDITTGVPVMKAHGI